ncbi:heparinase II/III domain-containing protein [Labilibacter marinus]|uniref:heparinase II/III domain-containing protein n=1 Tax=Labilibacter marinus TaxID=1477105 RepID=UPI00082FAC30|nr:heparinase II/III family protein [Labilibacter marinus]
MLKACFFKNNVSAHIIILLVLGILLFSCEAKQKTNVKRRPFILVTSNERAQVIEKIETQEWAKSIYANLINRIEKDVQLHQENPHAFLNKLPFDKEKAKDGKTPPFKQVYHIVDGVHKNLDNATKEEWATAAVLEKFLQLGVDCGMAYFVSEDKRYAQCAVDILHTYIQGVQQHQVSDWHGRGGWLFPDDGFREVRVLGNKVPLVYDFVAEYIKDGAKAYDFGKKQEVDFSIEDAQQVFRTYADITINYGHAGSNHSVLEAPNMVYNALAMEDEAERDSLLRFFLYQSVPRHQDALDVMAANFKEKGDIWPETSQYLNHSTSIIIKLMLVLDRYDANLRLGDKYSNVLYALPCLDFLVYPNDELIRWGDGKRFGSAPYYSYEDSYALAELNGLVEVRETFGPLINRAKKEKGYQRKNMESVFWYDNEIEGDVKSFSLNRTERVYHAGVFLQRNINTSNKVQDGLMCFVGGAHMVHAHAEGMNIELYGEGEVLGVDNGRGKYGLDIHENYSRLYAAHNTVIVNGSSQGEGGWSNLGINSVELISMEPQVGNEGVSPNYSFTQTSFIDDKGDKAEATQERTLSLIRTSPTTGYYVDVFRSKSSLPNQYHDYLYHNIGDALTIKNQDLQFKATPNRYMDNANDEWKRDKFRHPGWHFFKDVKTSNKYAHDIEARFNVKQLKQGSIYMQLFVPGFENREYTTVNAPHTFQAPSPYDNLDTPTLIIRKEGEAWTNPFVVVFEPFNQKEKNPSIQSVEKLEQNGIYKGLKVTSSIPTEDIVQYIITQSKGEVFQDSLKNISFKGSFAVITENSQGELRNMYIGEGDELIYNNNILKGNKNNCAYKTY